MEETRCKCGRLLCEHFGWGINKKPRCYPGDERMGKVFFEPADPEQKESD